MTEQIKEQTVGGWAEGALPAFTEDELKRFNGVKHDLADFVEEAGKTRAKAQGDRFNEVEFLVGAMVAFQALGLEPPVSWIFGPAVGRSVIQPEGKEMPQHFTLDDVERGVAMAAERAYDIDPSLNKEYGYSDTTFVQAYKTGCKEAVKAIKHGQDYTWIEDEGEE